MRFIDAEDDSPLINGVTCNIEDNLCTLRWLWPSGIDAVYVGIMPDEQEHEGALDTSNLKLYTRAEYKANNGYYSRVEGIGRYVFTVYACQEGNGSGGPLLILQPNRENSIEISAGKAQIHYSVRYKTGLFQKYKSIQIQVTTEVPIDKEVLCYVKKQGSYPANKEDGILYPFVAPFAAGKNILPPIEVGKQDYIRLFFTDGRKYGQMYELVSV
ncbi:beta-mannanase [Paenibacillus sp. GCM10028914]|uniref:beta-mannanase n=1 Tax=Paenibacillus sp. GCM10028914 TaxID=3273416 RepID=UPI00360C5EFE